MVAFSNFDSISLFKLLVNTFSKLFHSFLIGISIQFSSGRLFDDFVILSQHRPQVKHFFHLFSAFFMLLFFA